MADKNIKKISFKNQYINYYKSSETLKKLDILKELLVNFPVSETSQKQ